MAKQAHLWDPRLDRCQRCGLTGEALEARPFREHWRSACLFSFIPKTRRGRRSGWPRIKREVARLRKRGLLEEGVRVRIVGGHARPLPR